MENTTDVIDRLESTIKTLIENAWRNDLNISRVREWYSQFNQSTNPQENEQIQFLFLLTKFMYFGNREIMQMLRSLYNDSFKYDMIRKIREQHQDTLDEDFLNESFNDVLGATRFLGIGNPSESGAYLLYKFRQANQLSKELFINTHEIFTPLAAESSGRRRREFSIANPTINRYIFIDDMTASGQQAIDYSKDIVSVIKELNPNAEVCYFVLVATSRAIQRLQEESMYDRVETVFKLGSSFHCFENGSRYYKDEDNFSNRIFTRESCCKYDSLLENPDYVLGFDNSQLLISFEHNTPDNVPPSFWSDGKEETPWTPVFQRFHKIY